MNEPPTPYQMAARIRGLERANAKMLSALRIIAEADSLAGAHNVARAALLSPGLDPDQDRSERSVGKRPSE